MESFADAWPDAGEPPSLSVGVAEETPRMWRVSPRASPCGATAPAWRRCRRTPWAASSCVNASTPTSFPHVDHMKRLNKFGRKRTKPVAELPEPAPQPQPHPEN